MPSGRARRLIWAASCSRRASAISRQPGRSETWPLHQGADVRRFSEDNDPHGEHDFGSFEVDGENYFFKLDYYSPDMEGGSEDPADPEKTTRVLTIMRADEY